MQHKPSRNPHDSAPDTTTQGTGSPLHLTLERDFYTKTTRELVACCGYKNETPDFHVALDLLNVKLNLRMDEIDRRALSMMLTGLPNTRNWSAEIHIAQAKGESSATRSCHAMVLAHELFRRAKLLTPDVHAAHAHELHLAVTLGCLVHDLGEICGDIRSLFQPPPNNDWRELPGIKRETFKLALKEAFRAAHNYPYHSHHFYSFVRELRSSLGTHASEPGKSRGDNIHRQLQTFSERAINNPLPRGLESRMERFLAIYDMAAMKVDDSHSRAVFISSAVKVVKHLQALRHFMRFARVDSRDVRTHLFSPDSLLPESHLSSQPSSRSDSVLLHAMSSYQLLENSKSIEEELPALFVNTSSREERAFAHSLRDATYQNQVELLSIARPFIDRSQVEESPRIVRLKEKLQHAKTPEARTKGLLEIESSLMLDLHKDRERFQKRYALIQEPSQLRALETRTRMIQLYLRALEAGFEPTSTSPLLMLSELPAALSRLPAPGQDISMPPISDTDLRESSLPRPPSM